jgi:DNA (cytosine-5)-methyltransferase 1
MTYKPYKLQDVIDASNKELFTVISTFAGGGGSSTGYRLAGAKILAINEFVDSAVDTYKANYPQTPVLPGDIKELTGEDLLKTAGVQKGELDILDGSPPCSAFSISGKREKGWNSTKKYSDDKQVENIEDLFFEYIRIANDIQAKVVIGENVAGIMVGDAKKYFNRIINAFDKIGYEAVGKVMNAADFGTPQARQRCFFVAVRKDVMDTLGLNFMTMEGELYPKPNSTQPTLKDAIDDLENDKEEEQMLLDFVQGSFQKKWIELLPFNPDKHRKPSDPEFIDINPKRSMFNMIRPAPNLPCPTVTQAGQKKGLSGVFHYNSNRKLTIKELKRVMGLPDDFKLEGDFDQQAERVGRMVAPLMMKELSGTIYKNIIKPFNDR